MLVKHELEAAVYVLGSKEIDPVCPTLKIIKNGVFILFILSIFVFPIFGPNKLHGQGTWIANDLDQQIKEIKLNLGPFKIKPMFYLTAGHDSNIYMSSSNPIKDYSANVGPGFNIYLPIKKSIIFSISESPQYVYFLETKKQRVWNNYFNGQLYLFVKRFLLRFGKGYSVTSEVWDIEIEGRPRQKIDSLDGTVLYQLSKRSSVLFSYGRARYVYEGPSNALFKITELNRIENMANLIIYIQPSYRVKFFLDFEHGSFKFDNPLSTRDSKSYALNTGVEFSPKGVFRGKISLGYKYFHALKTGVKDYEGLVGDTGASIRPARFLNIRINYKRDIEFSAWSDNPYYLSNSIGGGISIYLIKNIRLDYDYNFGRNNYPRNSEIAQSSGVIRKDDYNNQLAGIYFRLIKNIGVGVTLNQWVRESNLAWLNMKRRFLGLNLTYDF